MLSNAGFVQVIAYMRSEGKDKQAMIRSHILWFAAAIIVALVVVVIEAAELYEIFQFNHKSVASLTQKLKFE